MGVVYRGFDPTIGRTVAIKTVRLDTGDPELLKRFRREAQAAGILSHPNIVTIYDAGEDEGVFYIAMELVVGETLQQILARGPLPVDKTIPLIEQVGAALDHAHDRQIIHRDIKPANIMISEGVAKVMDFGVAKMTNVGMTSTGQVLGTPSYMSPEVVKGATIDGRSDIFSLGVVLYETLTGTKPFVGDNITTVIYKIIGEQPEPPATLNPSLHAGLNYVVLKALAKNPEERYQNCAQLTADLKSYRPLGEKGKAAAKTAAATPSAVPRDVTGTVTVDRKALGLDKPAAPVPAAAGPAWARHKKSLLAGAGALVLALGAGVIWQTRRAPEPAPAGSEPERIVVPAPATSAPAQQPPAAPKAPPPAPAAAGRPEPARLQATVEIVTHPAGAEVIVDGRRQSTLTPSRFSFAHGEHKVSLRKHGYRTMERTVNVGRNTPPRMTVELVAEKAQRSEASILEPRGDIGRVVVRTQPPGATVLVNGQATNYRSPVNFALAPGKYKITVERDGFASETREVVVRKNQMIQFEAELKRGEGKRRRFLFR